MAQTDTLYRPVLKLNGQPDLRAYTAEITNNNVTYGETEQTTVVLFFTLQYLGTTEEGTLKYRSIVQKRLLLDELRRPVFEPSKAQKLALDVAKINDDLMLEVTMEYRFVGILNTKLIQKKWQSVKNTLLNSFSDLQTSIADFDWQMRTENIQTAYRHDAFYTFFFSNFFYQEFDTDKNGYHKKVLADGIHNLDIPIVEKQSVVNEDLLDSNTTISVTAELDVDQRLFPLAKINRFMGDVLDIDDGEYLEFTYNGHYKVRTVVGMVDSGELRYSFKVGERFEKTVAIKFNLENDGK